NNVENGNIQSTGAANMSGNGFNNFIGAGKGDNIIDGGVGIDTVNYFNAINGTTGVTIDLNITTAQNTGGSGTDTLISIESISGTAFDDYLTGDANNNSLFGSSGNDTMFGGDGN